MNSEILFNELNQLLCCGKCPTQTQKPIGECAAVICQNDRLEAYCYIWDENFNDCELIENKVRALGFPWVHISHALHETSGEYKNGLTEDGLRFWNITVPELSQTPAERELDYLYGEKNKQEATK